MKRIYGALSLLFVMIFMSACTAERSEKMYIEAAQLSKEERKVAELLGLNQGQHIYDFCLDDSVTSIRINTYELVDGVWQLIAGGGGQTLQDSEGRIALGFEKIGDGLRIAVQSENHGGSSSYFKDVNEDYAGMGCATSMLSDRTEVVYDREIPLVLQIVTSQKNVTAYVMDYFFQPEEYAKYNYEHVYAITVLFSHKTVNELSVQ